MKELAKETVQAMMNKKSFCSVCGKYGLVVDIRKHMFEKHYDHVLFRMGGNKKKLQRWMELKN